jgi:hypothetical protein
MLKNLWQFLKSFGKTALNKICWNFVFWKYLKNLFAKMFTVWRYKYFWIWFLYRLQEQMTTNLMNKVLILRTSAHTNILLLDS